MKKFLKKYSFVCGLLILAYVIVKIDFIKLIDSTLTIKLLPLTIGVLFIFPMLITKSIRWNYLKKQQQIYYSFRQSLLMYISGLTFGIITPGNVGEVVKIYYLKESGYPYSASLANVIWDRLIDFVVLTALALISSALFLPLYIGGSGWLYLSIILIIFIISYYYKEKLCLALVKKLYLMIIPPKYRDKWLAGINNFIKEIGKFNFKTYFWSAIISIIAWFIYFFQIYLFGRSVNLKVPFIYFAAATAITVLLSTLPISFIGIGVREASFMLLLSQFTENPESLIVLSELFILDYILIGIVGSVILTIKPIPVSLNT